MDQIGISAGSQGNVISFGLHCQDVGQIQERSIAFEAEFQMWKNACSKTVVVSCSERVKLDRIGATSNPGNTLKNIVE